MKLITRKSRALNAHQRWMNQYLRNGQWQFGSDKEATYCSLKALGENPAPEDVDIVIGNKTWTELSCNECGKAVDEIVQIGEEPDYESSTANICKPCLVAALEVFN